MLGLGEGSVEPEGSGGGFCPPVRGVRCPSEAGRAPLAVPRRGMTPALGKRLWPQASRRERSRWLKLTALPRRVGPPFSCTSVPVPGLRWWMWRGGGLGLVFASGRKGGGPFNGL